MKKPVHIENNLDANYTVTDAWANSGLEIKIPKSGYYLLSYTLAVNVVDDNLAVANAVFRAFKRGPNDIDYNMIPLMSSHILNENSGVGLDRYNTVFSQKFLYLEKGTNIYIGTVMTAGNNCVLFATSGDFTTKLEAIKLA